ncbi:MAG: serine/threonine protein kinase [Gemmatimonadota bacterium]|nr:serine/threonine protein kinase [Gemmatimonadota bacterium]
MSDPVVEIQNLLGDRYIVEKPIGQGGMATVYLAQDTKHDRQVAVKLLRPEIGALLGAGRFLHEIKLTSRLQHPHILPLYDSGEANNRIFYVMPFVDGESLRDRLRREHRLPTEAALSVVREVADALAYAHSHGVVHRDIKPENILLSASHALVTDFGIARAISKSGGEKWETLTSSGVVVGTPAYMSPEQAAGDMQIDGRSDIYSLGCVAYEMLVGVPPFTGPDGELKLVRRFTERAPSVRESRPAVSERIDIAIAKALELDPADRFTTADEFVRALFGPGTPRRSSGARGRARRGPGVIIPYSIAAVAAVVALLLIGQRVREDRLGTSSISAVAPIAPAPSPARDTVAATPLPSSQPATEPSRATSTRTPTGRALPSSPATRTRDTTTATSRPVSLPRNVLADALATRRRASDAGATTADLGRGDASMDSAQALARLGRLSDAMTQMSNASASWAAAENAARARLAAAEQQRSQVAPPVVTQALSPPAPVAAVVPEDARAIIEAIIDEYARAIASRDVDAVRRVYPGLTVAQQRAWEQFFQSTEQIQADLSIAAMEQTGSTADVSVAGNFDYLLRGSQRRENRAAFFRATFRREASGWRMVTVR